MSVNTFNIFTSKFLEKYNKLIYPEFQGLDLPDWLFNEMLKYRLIECHTKELENIAKGISQSRSREELYEKLFI